MTRCRGLRRAEKNKVGLEHVEDEDAGDELHVLTD